MYRKKPISYLKSFYSFIVWRHFSFQWCIRQTVDKATMQWETDDSARRKIRWHDRALRHRYCTIVSSHYLFTFPSNYHHCIVASSISQYRVIALSTQSTMARWCDSELHGPTRISYYTKLCTIFFFPWSKKIFWLIWLTTI